MTLFGIIASLFVGIAIGTATTNFFVVRKLKQKHRARMQQINKIVAQLVVQVATIKKHYQEQIDGSDGYERDEHGNIISPLQTGREGS